MNRSFSLTSNNPPKDFIVIISFDKNRQTLFNQDSKRKKILIKEAGKEHFLFSFYPSQSRLAVSSEESPPDRFEQTTDGTPRPSLADDNSLTDEQLSFHPSLPFLYIFLFNIKKNKRL